MARWELTEEISELRKAKLSNSPAFEHIADKIIEYGVVLKRGSEGLKRDRTIRRPTFLFGLASDSPLIDLFHNGNDGYRARYLRGTEAGQTANRYILNLITPKLIDAWKVWPRRPHNEQWLVKSLGAGAKVWIHQGPWALPWNRNRSNIALFVDEWQAHRNDPDPNVRKKVKLGSLCPCETSIVIKGLFIDLHETVIDLPKSDDDRARQIHQFGFT